MSLRSPNDERLSRFAIELFNRAAFAYDAVAQALSYGQYLRWQSTLINAVIERGVDSHSMVLDAATGTAGVARQLARTANCRIVGLDQSPRMLMAAQSKLAATAGRIQLVQGTALQLPFRDGSFDAVLFTYLFRYVDDPAIAMQELVRVARPGAPIGFVEFHVPPPPWKQLWMLHTRIVLPVAGRLISPGWYQVGRFLGPSIERFYATWSIPELYNLLRGAGLQNIDHRLMSLGGGLVMWGVKGESR